MRKTLIYTSNDELYGRHITVHITDAPCRFCNEVNGNVQFDSSENEYLPIIVCARCVRTISTGVLP